MEGSDVKKRDLTTNNTEGTKGKMVRVIFPLLVRKDGKPRKMQLEALFFLNGESLFIKRGVVTTVPDLVVKVSQNIVMKTKHHGYECFVSCREVES